MRELELETEIAVRDRLAPLKPVSALGSAA
jgi:hypothetical protein